MTMIKTHHWAISESNMQCPTAVNLPVHQTCINTQLKSNRSINTRIIPVWVKFSSKTCYVLEFRVYFWWNYILLTSSVGANGIWGHRVKDRLTGTWLVLSFVDVAVGSLVTHCELPSWKKWRMKGQIFEIHLFSFLLKVRCKDGEERQRHQLKLTGLYCYICWSDWSWYLKLGLCRNKTVFCWQSLC